MFFLLFFGIVKNSNNDLKNSYSSMGQPCYNKCKVMENWTTL
jgi:hypothetical protein